MGLRSKEASARAGDERPSPTRTSATEGPVPSPAPRPDLPVPRPMAAGCEPAASLPGEAPASIPSLVARIPPLPKGRVADPPVPAARIPFGRASTAPLEDGPCLRLLGPLGHQVTDGLR